MYAGKRWRIYFTWLPSKLPLQFGCLLDTGGGHPKQGKSQLFSRGQLFDTYVRRQLNYYTVNQRRTSEKPSTHTVNQRFSNGWGGMGFVDFQ